MNKSQKLYSQMIAGALVVSAVVAPTAVGAEEAAAEKTAAPTAGTALNNVTTKDAVKVTGVKVGDVVKVYNGDVVIGKATAKGTSVVVTIPKKFPADVTSVNVTRTAKGLEESEAVAVTVGPEPISEELEKTDATNKTEVIINNNVKAADTVEVKGLKKGEVVKVYADAEKTTLLAKGVAKSSKLTIKIPKKFKTKEDPSTATQTVAASEKVYVTRTSVDKLESSVLEQGVDYEQLTLLGVNGTSTADTNDVEAVVEVNNFARKSDIVKVTGLKEKDEVILYSDADKSVVLGKGVVKKGAKSIEIKVKGDLDELFIKDDGSGYNDLYVSVKRGDTHPSKPEAVAVKAPDASTLSATPDVENTLKKDTVTFKGLKEKDIVKVYAVEEEFKGDFAKAVTDGDATVVGTAKVKKDGKAAITIKGGFKTETHVYFTTLTEDGKLESVSTAEALTIDPEPSADAPALTDITVKNNVVTKDTVTVNGLNSGETVFVYADAAKELLLGQAKASKDGVATVTMKSQDAFANLEADGDGKKHIHVTKKSATENESATPRPVEVTAEQPTTGITKTVSIVNNITSKDTVTVSYDDMAAKDVVTVYEKLASDSLVELAKVTVKDKQTEVVVSLPYQVDEGQKIVATVTKYDLLEEATATEISVPATAPTIYEGTPTTTNNVGAKSKDTVTVTTGVKAKDVVQVYKKSGTNPDNSDKYVSIGKATVGAGKTDVTVTLTENFKDTGTPDTQTWEQVYVGVTSPNLKESELVTVSPTDEEVTTIPTGAVFEGTNNLTAKDTVKATGLTAKDVVTVYDKALSDPTAEVIGTATVAAGKTEAVVTLKSAFTTKTDGTMNNVYVTVTSENKRPSVAQPVEPPAEPKTVLTTTQLSAINNVTVADAVKVTGLAEKSVVNVYAVDPTINTTAKPIGTATVAAGKTEVEVALKTPFAGTTSVYVTATAPNMSVSNAQAVTPSAEPQTATLNDYQVETTNNVGKADVVTVTDLVATDVVNVYAVDPSADSAAKPIGTATVAANATSATVTLTEQMPNTVYVTLTADNKTESAALAVTPAAEGVTPAPKTTDISTTNVINSGDTKDTVKVANLAATDIVNVYAVDPSTDSAAKPIGTATVAADKNEAIVSLTQNFTSSDVKNVEVWADVYVTVTKAGMNESAATAVTPVEESKTTKLTASNVVLTNNLTGTKDKVKVTGVVAGDVIKIYEDETGAAIQSATVTEAHVTAGYIEITLKREFELDTATDLMKPIYVTRTTGTLRESDRFSITPEKEGVTPRVDRTGVAIMNNVNPVADTITITDSGLEAGDIVKVYAKVYADAVKTQLIEEHKVTTDGSLSITLDKQLPETGTSPNEFKELYITNTKVNKKESEAIEVTPNPEPLTPNLFLIEAKVANNVTKADTVTLSQITLPAGTTSLVPTDFEAGAKVKVYDAATDGNLLGEATVTANDKANKTVTVTLDKQLTETEVFVEYQAESDEDTPRSARPAEERIKATVGTQISPKSFEVTNYVTGADVINVTSGTYAVGDTFKFYDGTTILGEYTVTAATAPTTNTPLAITLSTSLPASSVIKASLVNDMVGTAEGEQVEVSYSAEKVSRVLRKSELTLYPEKLVINVGVVDGKASLVQIGDKVAVYNPTNNSVIAEMTMTVDGKIEVPFNLTDADGKPTELASGLYDLKLTQGVKDDSHKESDALKVAIEPTVPVTGATLAADGSSFTLKGAKPGSYILTDSAGDKVTSGTFTTVGVVLLDPAITAEGIYEIVVKEPHKVASAPFTINVTGVQSTSETEPIKTTVESTLKAITVENAPVGTTYKLTDDTDAVVAGTFLNGKFTLTSGTLTPGAEYKLTLTKVGYLPTEIKVTVPTPTP